MKIGTVTSTNDKGQLVIPKEMRKALGIDSTVTLNMMLTGKGIYIYPVEEFITKADTESSYLKLLEKTKGAWSNEDWDEIDIKRSEIELKASESRKNRW